MSAILKEAERLHALGFAVHLLHPKSKRPIESKWTSGARKELSALKAAYRVGMNLGVRLGKASVIGGGFLAVIDCDVKSEKPEHQGELRKKLKELFPDLTALTPFVQSGRGNGSGHFYFVSREPVSTKRLAQSGETVKVKMPSAGKPSAAELAALTENEIGEGIRLRPAWEIMTLGEGSQVVLPPSIHPDTGRAYVWQTRARGVKDFPLLTVSAGAAPKQSEPEETSGFKVVEVDLVGSPLPNEMVDLILSGKGCKDRSASLLPVAGAMVRAGYSDDEILTVLTDRETFLGETAFDHAKTESRTRAAAWVRKYTLKKARLENDARVQFQEECETIVLSDEAAEVQKLELTKVADWRQGIERGSEQSGGKPKNTVKNVILILRGEFGDDVFRRDEFSGLERFGQAVPWGKKPGEQIFDRDIIAIKCFLADHYRFEPSNDRINEAVVQIASENPFHPVKDYLSGLEWDGKLRIDTWLKDYMEGEAEEPYLSAVSRKILCAMVARIYEPGKKFDQVLILEGNQGEGKSTAVRMLASDKWFSDAPINITDKDGVLSMGAVWIVELGELSSVRKADVDQLKEFISRTTDRIRLPYGKRVEEFPRQCVFIGTTNSSEYLRDTTGNRRFWPVKVGRCDFKAIKRDRDQLLAEAKFAYELGEELYLEDRKAATVALEEQAKREESDVWIETIEEFFKSNPDLFNTDRFTMSDVFSPFGPFKGGVRDGRAEQYRAATCLRKLGFEKCVRKGSDGNPKKYWVSKPK